MRAKQPLIVGGQPEWWCVGCTRWLPAACFYRDRKSTNGLKSECRKCHMRTTTRTRDPEKKRRANREHMRRARKADPEKFRARDRRRTPRRRT